MHFDVAAPAKLISAFFCKNRLTSLQNRGMIVASAMVLSALFGSAALFIFGIKRVRVL
jgi:hypothetical protein